MPLITRRRAKRREVELRRSGGFPFRMEIPNLVEGSGPASRMYPLALLPWEYSDATLRCRACRENFSWSAEEQRLRYEVYQLSPYSHPPYCPDCSRAWRQKNALLASYDATVGVARDGHDLDAKCRVLAILGELDAAGVELTGRMIYTQSVLSLQLAAAVRRAENGGDIHSLTRNHRPLGR